MEKIGLNELREMFLTFYESKDHYRRQSYSLIPETDTSLLIINSGMAPLKPYFAGLETPPSKRMTNSQKCIRTGDIENVGYTDRHGTFFEMLGSFSFGDYFKRESILWGWEFITQVLKMPEDKVWATVYEEDMEAREIWEKEVGMPKDRIVALGKEHNFWEIGTGPCGPCSEIYFDRGPEKGCGKKDCKPGCECDRYIEFWNHVFTQYNKDDQGNYTDLKHKNIDTGMGLERIAVVMQDVNSIFDVDTIKVILDSICKKAKVTYGYGQEKQDISLRIITDHLRSICFMIADGILPGNEGRGYVLRRLLRRAARHGRLLGIKGTFLGELSKEVVTASGDAYPELVEKEEYLKKIIVIEEDKFASTIDQGEAMINDAIKEMEKQGKSVLPGEKAFKLYDTYGFPLELTQEILEESGLKTDINEFNIHMDKQREQARAARKSGEEDGWSDTGLEFELKSPCEFVGYNSLDHNGQVIHIFKDNQEIDSLKLGETGQIICHETPFYPEGGGQSTDTGLMYNDDCSLEVLQVYKLKDAIIHKVICHKGQVKVNDYLTCVVSIPRRFATARNHTATHLLHKALKEVLGDHVQQAGSQVTADGLRFDFNHFQGLTNDELTRVEDFVNNAIDLFAEVKTKEISMKQATEEGITALFGEKYGEQVRVVTIDNFSQELCGGTHVNNAGEIGAFMIQSEGGIASGVRRIEAITGRGVLEEAKNKEATLEEIASSLKVNAQGIPQKIYSVLDEIKTLKKEIETIKKADIDSSLDQIIEDSKVINGVRLITHIFKDYSIQDLREISDDIKANQKETVIVFATTNDDKVTIMVTLTDDLLDKGYHAGKMIKEIAKAAGGGGGGKADMAQAGAKDPSKLHDAFKVAIELMEAIV